ncbi:hypothetical protein [Streptomyces humi]|uniref:hypothetical protein n=1 Tax=Streptomyces humi TaxID=1428620 RepID=UPI0006289778|nr:hypothetical protein [Streptomyces humi]
MEPGTLLYDTATDQVGEYRDRSGPYAILRPVGGGREWEADPATLRPATDRERISAGVRAANDRTRSVPPDPEDLSRPPRPVPGCAECAELGDRRESALVAYDHSAAVDANVLLRQHQRAGTCRT